MAGASNPRSLGESPLGRLVGVRGDQRLPGRLASAQAVETDLLPVQIHHGADQAMNPGLADAEVMAQKGDVPARVGAAQENNLSLELLEIEFPAAGDGRARRSGLDARGRADACRGD